jgi:predicted O-methyltransferase YrrM
MSQATYLLKTPYLLHVPTAMSPGEVFHLAELATDRFVLEIGSWYGHSTFAMASVAKHVTSIDWHRGDSNAGFEDTTVEYFQHMRNCGLGPDKITTIIGLSDDILPLWKPQPLFDLAFIDGYHAYSQVLKDAWMVYPLMKHGGIVAFHDYGRFIAAEEGNRGVGHAVDDFAAKINAPKPEVLDMSLAIVRLP